MQTLCDMFLVGLAVIRVAGFMVIGFAVLIVLIAILDEMGTGRLDRRADA